MAKLKKVLHDKYHLVIAAKESQKLGIDMGRRLALVTTGRESYLKLRESAGIYGVLLDVLRTHKWIDVKLASVLVKNSICLWRGVGAGAAIGVSPLICSLHNKAQF